MADVVMTLADQVDGGHIEDKAAMFAQRFRANSDVLNRLGFVNAPTGSYGWVEELTLPTSYWVGINATDPDTSKATYQPHAVSTSLMRAGLFADNMQQGEAEAQGSKTGTITMQAQGHAKSMMYAAELALFDGEPTTDAAEPQGLNSKLTVTSGADTNLINADGAGTVGANITVDMLEDLVDAVDGGANALLMSKPMRRELKKLFRNQSQLEYQDEIGFTQPVLSFEGVPILIIGKGRARTEILGFDETVGTSTTCGSIYGVRFDIDGFFGLQNKPMEVLPAVASGPYKKEWGFQWKMGFATFRPNVAVRLRGITAA